MLRQRVAIAIAGTYASRAACGRGARRIRSVRAACAVASGAPSGTHCRGQRSAVGGRAARASARRAEPRGCTLIAPLSCRFPPGTTHWHRSMPRPPRRLVQTLVGRAVAWPLGAAVEHAGRGGGKCATGTAVEHAGRGGGKRATGTATLGALRTPWHSITWRSGGVRVTLRGRLRAAARPCAAMMCGVVAAWRARNYGGTDEGG